MNRKHLNNQHNVRQWAAALTLTRKLSYRKDDTAMRLIYGCSENFRESLSTPTATFPEIFNGRFFRSIIRMCVQNLKFVALPVPGIIRVSKKFGHSLDTPALPFLKNVY